MSESMAAENYEQSLSVFAVYGVSAFSNHSINYKNENLSFTTDVNYDLITVNSTEEEINSFYFYKYFAIPSRHYPKFCTNGDGEERITCTLIPGDGVGPDLVKSVRQVFEAANIPIDFETYHLSEIDTMGSATLDEVARSIRKNRIALKGTLAYPDKSQTTELETMNMKLRKRLDLFANVVHIQSLAGLHCRHSNINIDTIIIREQTEGEYSALEHESVKGVVECLKIITALRSRKIAKFAFDYATYLNRKKVTAVHKANIMKLGDGLFLKSCDEMARLYPKLKYEKMIIDNCTMQLVAKPQQFDVLLTPNLYGNIIDNLAAGLVGGAGMVAGSSYSQDCVVFEPGARHTFQVAVGKQIANPTAMLLASAKLLAHCNLHAYSCMIKNAINKVLKKGDVLTKDIGGCATTDEYTEEIINNLEIP